MKGKTLLAQLRAQNESYQLVKAHAKFAPERPTFHVPAVPVSKRASKSAGSKTRTLKVRNWQIRAAHFN